MADNGRRDYELVYIAQPETSDEAITAINRRLVGTITAQDGEMHGIDLWGRRKLAYPINNHFEGHYVLHSFEMPPSGTDDIDLALRFDEDVIRYLLMLTDEPDEE